VHVIVWRFKCREGRDGEFEKAYASDGDWARLFARAAGFLNTELLKSSDQPLHYVTIDRWVHVSDFEAFKVQWGAEYRALDDKCSELTESEESIGAFTSEV
jgi:heme-degrading monooxygenase HmoA